MSGRSGSRPSTYLDWNATAPLRPEAVVSMTGALERCGNPSSVHGWGRSARRMVEDSRAAVAAMIGALPESVVFGSGGTEANHLALRGAGRERVLASAVEHDSVLRAVFEAERIPVDPHGRVRLDALAKMLASEDRPALVSVMLANNETGVIQPVAEIAALAHAHGALFHCDAVQAAGKLSLDVAEIGADLLTLSAHKLGGPPGIGALILTPGMELTPIFCGGGQERGHRAGTENILGIVGFGAAARVAEAEIALNEHVRRLRDALEAEIIAAGPEAIVVGGDVPRLPNTAAIAIPGISAETQVIALDLDGVMVSAGAACSSGKVGPSHVLAAMDLPVEIASSTIRVSLGWSTTEGDVDRFIRSWTALYRRRRSFGQEARAA
jgi:cysteine desulfurase